MHTLLEQASKVPHSFDLGNLSIFPNVYLSSMHGVTDLPFRRLISYITQNQTGILTSEFVAANEILQNNPRALKQMKFCSSQSPFSIQIYGGDPKQMGEAAKVAAHKGAQFVEINSGCPAPKVVSKQCGSGLLLDLGHFRSVVRSVVQSVSVPVSVKVRVGYYNSKINVLDSLKIAEEEGLSLFVIHGRTREQGYKGFADWNLIGKVKKVASIPIIGNGDVLSVENAVEKLNTYGVDGVSVGRGALHNPWIFREVLDVYAGKEVREPHAEEQYNLFSQYKEFLLEETPVEKLALGRLKQLAARVLKTYSNSKDQRKKSASFPYNARLLWKFRALFFGAFPIPRAYFRGNSRFKRKGIQPSGTELV